VPAAVAHAKAPSPAPLIVIDAGHGGRYSNANANRLKEKNVNLAIAKELRTALTALGYRVVMTRTTDRAVVYSDIRTWTYSAKKDRWIFAADGHRGSYGGIPRDDLQGRVNIANAAGADLFISIHANGSRSRKSRGTETWKARRDRLGSSLAPYVQRNVVKATKLKNRGTHTADFYVCRWSNMPSVLVESAFISSPRDARLLKKAWFRRRLARGIATGVDQWMNKKPYTRKYPRVTASSPSALAAAVSAADFPAGAPAAVVVRSDKAADVPGAAGLATKYGVPLLMAGATGPDEATASELGRLAPKRLIVVGVEGSFDTSAVASLAAASTLPTSSVELISSPDRPGLAASVATSMGPAAGGEVFIANAADALTSMPVAPLSASHGIPILLASNGSLGPDAQYWLAINGPAIRRVVLVGSALAVPAALAGGRPYTRIDATSYTERSSKLNSRYYAGGPSGSMRPVAATLLRNDEYLVAATRAGRRRQPLIPVTDRVLPAFTREWITNRRSAIGGFEVITCGSIPYLMDHMLAKAEYQ